MTKADIVDIIKTEAKITQKEAELATNAFINSITKALANRDKVAILGFGTFEASFRAARKGHNPQTGETIEIAEAYLPTFKAGKNLKDAVNKAK